MKIETRFFGEVEIDETKTLSFKNGIPGFENLTSFALLDFEDNENLKFLQSLEEPSICLTILSPWTYFNDYQIQLSDEEIRELELQSETDAAVYNVLTIREDKITVNLLAPVIINVINNRGKQIILSESKYSIRQEIACL